MLSSFLTDTFSSVGHVSPDTFSSVEHVLSEKNKKNMERQQVTDNLVLRRPTLYKIVFGG